MNAKEEFLKRIIGFKVICATVDLHDCRNDDNKVTVDLKPKYTEDEYQKFINRLDFNYDNGYGDQNLFGTIWCEDGVWMDRGEYDGSEWWDVHSYPVIPEDWAH
jgi:hypothetical protein